MDNWKTFADRIKESLKSKNLSAAKEELATGLEKFQNQPNLLSIATDVYRASGDRKKSLGYSELLITYHPGNWNGYGRAAQDLVALKRFEQAQEKIQAGLEKIPNQVNLLTIASDVYRASGDREKSLEYSELLITHHPDNWNGYGRAAQNLSVLKRFKEAQEKIQAGLEKNPNQVNLLTIASDIYRTSGDPEKSLGYSELLITHYPDNWNGYGRAAQNLSVLKRFKEAQEKIQAGLEKNPNQVNLLTIASDVYRTSGDPEKSLGYSELLITHHPDNWNGYGRAAQNLSVLKRFKEAQEKIQAGLEKNPNQVNLLTIASDIYRTSGDPEKSLGYSELLITHYPDNWNGYGRAAQNLSVLKRFKEAQEKIQAGLEKNPNQVNLLTIASDVYRTSGDPEKSLGYSELLITHHPDNWNGYGRAAQNLSVLKRFKEAQEKIQAGLEKNPNQVNLLTIASDVYLTSGDREKSLEYANKMHYNNAKIPTNIFSELLIYSFKKSTQRDANQHKSQVAAIDWFHNRQFMLSSDQMPFNFIFIPKNACSSIKYSLLNKFTDAKKNEIQRNPHSLANKKLKSDLNIEKEVICLVRNPFSRFISAYTDKCKPGGDRNVWLPMCKKYGFDPTSRVSMDTLLDALLADEPNLIDGHFRPQHKITCSSAITPSRIFYMEKMNEFASFLQTHDCEFIRYAPHSTKATAKTHDELDSKTIDKIYCLYKNDFALYGYSENPQIKDSLDSIVQSPHISDLLTSKDVGAQLCRDFKERDSLLFEDLFLEKAESLRTLVNNSII